MQSPTMDQFNRLSEEVQHLGAMMERLMDLLGTLGGEMRDGFRSQQAEMQSMRDEMQSMRDEMEAMRSELTEKIESLRHDLRSERRARGHVRDWAWMNVRSAAVI